jgi:integrase
MQSSGITKGGDNVKMKPKTRGNGQGSVYKLPNGKYRAEVTLGYKTIKEGEKEKKKRIYKTKSGFKTKREAITYLAKLKQTASIANVDIKFSELYDEWSEKYFEDISKSTADCYRSAYKYYKDLYFVRFADIKTDLLQDCIDKCPHGRRTKENMKALGTLLYKYALARDIVDKNYAALVRLPREGEKEKKDIFSSEEIKSLWEAFCGGDIIAGYILTMIYTGMRYGELAKVELKDIRDNYIIGGIKTEAGRGRAIPVCDKLKPVIEKLKEGKTKKLLDIKEKPFYNMYYETLERANVRKLTPHTCRHTCATALAAEGVPPSIIQQILGHSDYATTANVYTNFDIDKLIEAVNKLK